MPTAPQTHENDLASYPAPHLAVDLVLLTISDGALKVMMMKRGSEPFADQLVLPGGFVHPGEMLDDTARRVLACKVKLSDVKVEQLYTFSAPGRDPRGWVVSAAYFALMPSERLIATVDDAQGLELVAIRPIESGRVDASRPAQDNIVLVAAGETITPGFDHAAIITAAVERLRGKLDWSMVAFGLLDEEFTLYELQRVHELILGRAVNKPHFRKKMLERTLADGRRLVATGRTARPGRHRPAELYRLGGEGA